MNYPDPAYKILPGGGLTKKLEYTIDKKIAQAIEEIEGGAPANYDTLQELAEGKQDKLVSGTNIKTLNSASLLGSGDLTITTEGVVIVDDLTTGGSSAALSAEMGYVLGQKVDVVVEDDSYMSPNIFDKTTAVVGYIAATNGWFNSVSSAEHATDYLDIPSGATSMYTTLQTYSGVTGWACYDSNKTFTHGGQTQLIQFQTGDAYVRVTIRNTNLDTAMIVVGTSEDMPSTYMPYGTITNYVVKEQIIGYENFKSDVIADDLLTSDSTKVLSSKQGNKIAESTMQLVVSENILDPSTITIGSYVRKDTGELATWEGYGCTDFIELPQGGLTCNSCAKTTGAYNAGAVGFGSDKTTVKGYMSPSTSGDLLTVNKSSTEHSDWAYVRFNIYLREDNHYMVVKGGSLPSEFKPYFAPYYHGLKKVSTEETTFFTEQPATENILNPDSIIENSHIIRQDGSFSNSTYFYRTDYIPIDERGLFCNHSYPVRGTYDCGCCVYNANKEFICAYGSSEIGASISVAYQEGFAYVVFNILNEYDISEVYICRGTQPLPNGYVPYVGETSLDPSYLNFSSISKEDAQNITDIAGVYNNDVEIVLPNRFYAVVGDTLQLFYQGLVIAPLYKQYDVFASASIGKGLGRYFETTPVSAGTSTFTLQLFDQNMNALGTKSCEIKVVNAPSNPASNKNVLCIGDSLTAGGYWVCELQRRLKASDGTPQGLGLTNITLVGSNTSTKYGQTAHHYGNSGWGWQDFCTVGRAAFRFHLASADNVSLGNVYTNNGFTYTAIEINNIGTGGTDDWTVLCSTSATTNTPQSSGTLTLQTGTGGNLAFTSADADGANLLWDSQADGISFKKYCTVSAGMSNAENLDYLLVLLTWNGLPSTENQEDWATIVGCIHDMLDAVHADYPTCKVKLMSVQFPYIDTYVSATSSQHTFQTIRIAAYMNKLYRTICEDDNYSSFAEFVNISGQFDSQYNYPFTAKPVNTRNSSVTENYVNNSVHPGETGYLQIADAAYRAMCAALNE